MKEVIKKICLFLLIIGIALLAYYKSKIVFATSSSFPNLITYNPAAGDFTAPFTGNAFTDGATTYCRQHGKHLYSRWGKVVYRKINDEDLTLKPRLAYAFYNSDIYTRQNIIWHLTQTNVNKIARETNGKVVFKVLNTGSETVDRPSIINKAIQYVEPADDPKIKIDTSNVQIENKNIDGTKYCVISNVKMTIGKLGTDGSANLKVLVDGNSIDTYKMQEGILVKCEKEKGREISDEKIGETSTIKIYIKSSDVKDIKNINIKVLGKYYRYSGGFVKYQYDEEKSDAKGIQSDVQDMMRLHVDRKDDTVDDEVTLDMAEPRIITTKYVQSIKRDGETIQITGSEGLAQQEGKQYLKPTCKVYPEFDAKSNGRYNLTVQDLTKDSELKAKVGDELTYVIRVYNVGDTAVDLDSDEIESDKEQYLGEKTGKGTGKKIVKNGVVWDYPDEDCLEFIDDSSIWTKKDGGYFAQPVNLSNAGKIGTYKDNKGDLEGWSSYIKIKFRVKNCDKGKIVNNAHEILTGKTPRLITTKEVQSVMRDGKNVFVKPSVVTTGKEHLQARYEKDTTGNYNFIPQQIESSDVNLQVGDIITYRIKVYNIGQRAVNVAEDPTLKSDKEQYVGEKLGEGTGPIVLENKRVYDYYDKDTLEFVGDGATWKSGIKADDGTVYYYTEARNLNTKGVMEKHEDGLAEEKWSSWVEIKFKVKDLSKGKIKNNANVIGDNPRLITTKEVQSIKHKNSTEEIKITGAKGLASNPGKEHLEARCTVDLSKSMYASDRYNLKVQDLSKDINLVPGDEITYRIKVYNVGNETVNISENDMVKSDPEQKLGEEPGKGTGPIVVQNRKVFDFFDTDCLEFIGDSHIWKEVEKDGKKCYSTSAANLSGHGIIKSYKEDHSTQEAWSSYITIKFRVKQKEKFTQIKNNGNEAPGYDKQTVKYLYSHNGTQIEGWEPKITVDTTKAIGDTNRVNITSKKRIEADFENGDTLVYGIRYYSTATNSIQLNFTAKDIFGEGLKFQYATKKTPTGTIAPTRVTESYIEVLGLDEILPGYEPGKQVPYYDVYLHFKIDVRTVKDGNTLIPGSIKMSKIENSMEGEYNGPIVIEKTYTIKGKVFIDEKIYDEGKTTIPGDALLGRKDKPVPGVTVELYEEDGKGNGLYFSRRTTTNSEGEYEFTNLQAQHDCTCGMCFKGCGPYCYCFQPAHKYLVKFIYNGQEYENVKYNADEFSGNGSYAKENANGEYVSTKFSYGPYASHIWEKITFKMDTNDSNRKDFNDKFATIDSSNSETLSLKDDLRKSPSYTDNGYAISAYTTSLIDPNTSYREHVNLGLVKREFDLSIENKLVSMDISINGVNQNLVGNGSTIKETIKQSDLYQDLYLKEADYKYIDDIDYNNELSVWANYEVTVTNSSKDNFIGILNNIDWYFDNKFDEIKINKSSISQDYWAERVGGFNKVSINGEWGSKKEIDNTADNNKTVFKISLHLTRQAIADAIQSKDDNDYMKTVETLAEISSYSTKYSGDIYNNENGIGRPNAGKIDEDSNAGNFDLRWEQYVNEIRKSTDVSTILGFLDEDDTSRAVGIKLIVDANPRKLEGIVFEDNTTGGTGKERLGDGYKNAENEKLIGGVKVELLELRGEDYKLAYVYNDENVTYEETEGKDFNNMRSNIEGKYTLKGFIPSQNYIVRFTYGDGQTSIYNAQDYKSTIDKTEEEYKQPNKVEYKGTIDGLEHAPDDENEYWYNHDNVVNASVAKDEDMKMGEKKINYKEAVKLEKYEEAGADWETFGNTAITKTIFAPIRQRGNRNSGEEEYIIQNINLGLAERPRSELQLEKVVSHVTVTATDGTTLAEGDEKSTATAKSISWTDRYVQPIIDENLIYGSTLSVTYRYTITNTGEVDYYNKGANNEIGGEGRSFYDYGKKLKDEYKVTTKPVLVDYIDNKFEYDKDAKIYRTDESRKESNSYYWKDQALDDSEKEIGEAQKDFDNNGDNGREYFSTVIKTLELSEDAMIPMIPNQYREKYLTLTRKLPNAELGDQLTYNNYAEILTSTNSAGRRNYSVKEDKLLSDVLKDERGIIKINDINDSKNKDKYILSIPGNIPGEITNSEISNGVLKNEPGQKPWVTLALYNETELKGTIENLTSGEPDSAMAQEIQIIQPFGDQTDYNKTIWIITIATSAIIISAGIYLIKKKVL